jgi:hypothetical protein
MNDRSFIKLARNISRSLRHLPLRWGGKKTIRLLRREKFNWKQNEWIGWYFEFQCKKRLANVMDVPGPRYGRPMFDGLKIIPWDFKSHVQSKKNRYIIVNDRKAMKAAVAEYGAVGLILAKGDAEFDSDGAFKRWHDKLKGGMSKFERERKRRKAHSTERKTAFVLREIEFIKIDDEVLRTCPSFQKDFRNSNGKPRKDKVRLRPIDIQEEKKYTMRFG